eukprot:COSAG01_NODE_47868_length_386_cov_0.846690_1_plen_24_part_01
MCDALSATGERGTYAAAVQVDTPL